MREQEACEIVDGEPQFMAIGTGLPAGSAVHRPDAGIADQDVEPIVPEIVQEFATPDSDGRTAEPKMALDYPKLTALLIEAVKALAATLPGDGDRSKA